MYITITLTILLCLFDKSLKCFNIDCIYYLNHFIVNSLIVYYTYDDLLLCYTDLNNINKYDMNVDIVEYTFSIHLYHIIIYYNKFYFDDWLHHIIMILFTLPMGLYFNTGPIMSHCLFFMSGLPGGINYLLLFLQRNDFIKKKTQKYINYHLNIWIRNPGCIASSIITYFYYINFINFNYDINNFFVIYIILSCFWNGVYFMEQVVRNYNLLYPIV